MTEHSLAALIVLVTTLISWSASTMNFVFHHMPLRAGDRMHFMCKRIFCLTVKNYWSNPLFGACFGFNYSFSYFASRPCPRPV